MLNDLGIWQGPSGWDDMQVMPRYFPGRPILVKAPVHIEQSSPAYMTYNPQAIGKEKFVTHKATLLDYDKQAKKFTV